MSETPLPSTTDQNRPSVTLITAIPFSGELLDKDKGNWRAWNKSMYGALALNGLWNYTMENARKLAPNPDLEPRAFANWEENDRRLCAYIFTALSDNELNAITPLRSNAYLFWKTIEDRHKKDGPIAQVHLIKSAMNTSLSSEEPYHTTMAEVFRKIDEAWAMGEIKQDLLKLILGINCAHSVENIQFALLDRMSTAPSTSPFTPLDMIKFVEDRQRVLKANQSSSANTIALAAQTKPKPPAACTNCKRPHHIAKYCISAGGGMAGKTLDESRAARRKDRDNGKGGSSNSNHSEQGKQNTIPVTLTDNNGRAFIAHIPADTVITQAASQTSSTSGDSTQNL
ncbi:hypothetical protein D9613_004442 [Agrocybe pediades]|uniref:Uncharacterized protein n=1 Tax=Agrocybe pediades TaxID=84607 RepID=A0A8H4VL39_9AGAR|nr:hypothetical protein D9613_004442 [Agrocybe pediades]